MSRFQAIAEVLLAFRARHLPDVWAGVAVEALEAVGVPAAEVAVALAELWPAEFGPEGVA